MTPEQFVDIFRDSLWLVLTLTTAVILPALCWAGPLRRRVKRLGGTRAPC